MPVGTEGIEMLSMETSFDGDPQFSPEDRAMLWKACIKLPMYWVAAVPVMVGASAAYFDIGIVPIGQALRLLLGSISVIAWLNLSNDVFDYETGVDRTKHESVVNLCRNKHLAFGLSLMALIVGIGLLASVLITVNGYRPSLMLASAIACGYLYQGPPFRWSYIGLGEPLCFLAFGPLATSAFYLALSGATVISSGCWAASILVGITTTIILFCSHFHQYDSDKAVAKMSPVVRLGGASNALDVLGYVLWGLFAMAFTFSFVGLLPKMLLLLGIVPAPLAVCCFKYGRQHLLDLWKLRRLKLYAIDLHSTFGFVLALCFALSRGIL